MSDYVEEQPPEGGPTLKTYATVFGASFVILLFLDILLSVPLNLGVFLIGAGLMTGLYHLLVRKHG